MSQRTQGQPNKRKQVKSSLASLEKLEDSLARDNPPDDLWESLKRIASDLWGGAKQVAADLGITPADAAKLLAAL